MGIGNVTVLHDYYKNRVLKYHENMLETCQNLLQEYEKAKNPELRLSEEKTAK